MSKSIIKHAVLILFVISIAVYAQETCKCPPAQDSANSVFDTTFIFSNGNSIILCGSREIDTKGSTFSDFSLRQCGKDSVLGFWNENKTCRINQTRDALTVEYLINLPVGKDYGYMPVPFLIDKVFFTGNRVKRTTNINSKVRKYTQGECASIIKKYEETPKPIVDDLEDVINKLFMAALSGNRKAKALLMDFTKVNPELDGDSQEQYNELMVVLGYLGQQ